MIIVLDTIIALSFVIAGFSTVWVVNEFIKAIVSEVTLLKTITWEMILLKATWKRVPFLLIRMTI